MNSGSVPMISFWFLPAFPSPRRRGTSRAHRNLLTFFLQKLRGGDNSGGSLESTLCVVEGFVFSFSQSALPVGSPLFSPFPSPCWRERPFFLSRLKEGLDQEDGPTRVCCLLGLVLTPSVHIFLGGTEVHFSSPHTFPSARPTGRPPVPPPPPE